MSTEAPPPRKHRKHKSRETVEVEKGRAILATAKAFGATDKQALAVAGYSESAKEMVGVPAVRETIAAIRERLQGTKGYTLEESLEFYRKIADDVAEKTAVRMAARKELDSKLGYNVAQKVEVSEKKSLSMAISCLSGLRMDSMRRLRDASCEEAVAEEEASEDIEVAAE
jgi:hypothetical protein